MEIVSLVEILGSAAIVYCGAIFLVSAGMFFFDRSPARKGSVQQLPLAPRSFERHDEDHEDYEDRRAA